jgi:hypothetical protein
MVQQLEKFYLGAFLPDSRRAKNRPEIHIKKKKKL